MALKTAKEWFNDDLGRTVLLRGVNLGGSSKVPVTPNGATHIKTDFRDHRKVSFVGHPFPLKEADEHFQRLKHWGFNCLRFLVTWEAIEHQGPNQYDKEYLDYVEDLLKIAESYEFYTFIDPHQDVWSRMSGGDGAPGWIFEKVGLDFTKFDASEAAFVMQYRYNPNNPKAYPPMHWDSNNVRFANATIWTLFFGGKDFAPSCKIDGINVQDYMQQHYFESVKQVALRIKDNSSIIGFDTLNEPKQGWIEEMVDGSGKVGLSEIQGYNFTPIDAMLTAAGYSRTICFKEVKGVGIKETRRDILNKEGVSCWLKDAEDIWRKEGVWDYDDKRNPIILKNDYFVHKNGKKVDFYADYLSPFIINYANVIRGIFPNAIIFFEGPETKIMMGKQTNFDLPKESFPLVNAAHWYDAASSITKKAWLRFNLDIMTNKLVLGTRNVQKMFSRQLKFIKDASKIVSGGIPTLIGEFGLHYDINHKVAYKRFKENPEKAFNKNIKALNMYYNALDANLLHSTQWNYTADNNNEWGDIWNLEDLSIFSRDQQLNPTDINSGGRAIKGFCRPHFVKCAGIPLKMNFNFLKKTFYFEFNGDVSIKEPTIVYVPKIHYPNDYDVELSEGEIEKKEAKQLLFVKIKKEGFHYIKIVKR